MIWLIPDTNFLLHHQPLEAIDPSVFGFGLDSGWVITDNVLWELDDKKRHPDNRLSKRAKRQLEQIAFAQDNGGRLRRGALLRVHVRQHMNYEENGLDSVRPDHRIIADILDFCGAHDGADVVVLTGDRTMKSAVQARGLQALEGPETLRLPPFRDDADREIERLRRRISELEDVRPSFQVIATDGTRELRFSVPRALRPEVLDRHIDSLVKQPSFDVSAILGAMWQHVPEEEYDSLLSAFRATYREYILERYQSECRIFPLDLNLENVGGQRGESVSIELRLPAIGSVVDEPAEIKPVPRVPERFRMRQFPGLLGSRASLAFSGADGWRASRATPPTHTGPDISECGSDILIEYWFAAVRQRDRVTLKRCYVSLPADYCGHRFAISYVVRAGNGSGIDEGNLYINIDHDDAQALRSWLHTMRGEATGIRTLLDDEDSDTSH